jgi:two-component system sensor histidine kinase KdpD
MGNSGAAADGWTSARLLRTFSSVLVVEAITWAGYRLIQVNATTIAFLYLIAIILIALRWGLTESVAASIASVLSLNYFYIPPIGSFTVQDPENWVALFAFLMTSFVITQLSVRARREALTALSQRAEMERLYSFSRGILLTDPSRADAAESPAAQIAHQLVQVFDCPGAAVFDGASGQLYCAGPESLDSEADRLGQTVVHGTTERDQAKDLVIFAISLGGRPIGSAAIRKLDLSEPARESLANLIAIGLERAHSFQSAGRAEAARQSEELKSTLLDAIAHEFKTPLTSIKAAASGLLVLADKGPPGSPERELASIVEEETDRLNVLVSETIRMARIEAGKVRLERTLAMPEDVVRTAIEQLGSRAVDRSVSIRCDSGLGPVLLDPELFAIAIRQALDNALKYSPQNRPVEVLLSEPAGELVVEIRDHGPGIPPREQAQVFEKFYRGMSTGRHVAGSGMGLSIAREIIELHGGRAWIESRPGDGVSFFAAVPVAGSVSAKAVQPEAVQAETVQKDREVR